MNNPPPDRRHNIRGTILVTQVKMGDERRYFFGYATNISRTGIFIQTISPRKIGDRFNIELTVPKTDISVKCACEVVWARTYSKSGNQEPGMGLNFVDLDPAVAERVEQWVISQADPEG